MKKNRFLKLAVFTATALVCSGTLFIHTSARAQCPTCDSVPTDDAQHNPAVPPWNGPFTTTIMLDGCTVTICYASRMTSSANYDYCITQLCVQQPCGTNLDQLRDEASGWLMYNNPSGFPCPTCPSRDIEWSENMASCWSTDTIFDPSSGITYYVTKICPQHGWCLNAYWVCCDPDTHAKTFVYDRTVKTTYQCKSSEGCNQVSCPSRRDRL